ncbi:hypothetical protein K9L16_00365 [Candidatus Pacearchaeota archaeon]|nr:hypothetical protein [Candidatus Pacearchaeota archaeon]
MAQMQKPVQKKEAAKTTSNNSDVVETVEKGSDNSMNKTGSQLAEEGQKFPSWLKWLIIVLAIVVIGAGLYIWLF